MIHDEYRIERIEAGGEVPTYQIVPRLRAQVLPTLYRARRRAPVPGLLWVALAVVVAMLGVQLWMPFP